MLFSFVIVLIAVNANALQVLQNRSQLCLSCRLGRLFCGDFLHMYLEMLLVVFSSAYARHTEKTEMCVYVPEETSMYG